MEQDDHRHNSGIITDAQAWIAPARLAHYFGGQMALVAQGGGQRGIFTAGVLDAFLAAQFDPFDAFYGTSAGALNLCAFLCRQPGLGKAFITDLTTDERFFHRFRYLRRKQYLRLDWALEQIQQPPYQLDIERGRAVLGKRPAMAALTHAHSLRDVYRPFMGSNWQQVLLASCAIPRLCESAVSIDGHPYVDGGVSAAIPVQEAWRQGNRCIVVIRTEHYDPHTATESTTMENAVAGDTMQEHGASGSGLRSGSAPKVMPFPPTIRSLHPIDPLTNLVQQWLPHRWAQKLDRLRIDWRGLIQHHLINANDKTGAHTTDRLNGGRWLFGAEQIYRISSLLGDKFDASLADMLMVHYQTYALTQDFLLMPPDDCFVVQIMPSLPLRSRSLLSSMEDLLHDYELGVQAGEQLMAHFCTVSRLSSSE